MKGPGGPEQAALSQPPRRPTHHRSGHARRPDPSQAGSLREFPRRPVPPRLFQLREPRRHFGGVTVLIIALHVAVLAWAGRTRVASTKPAPEPVKVVLKLPVRKVAVNQPPGGAPKRLQPPRPHVRRRRIIMPKIVPPPVVEPPPPPIEEPPKMAEAEEAGDDDDGDPSAAPGGVTGTGVGAGVGPGAGAVKSKARKAWLLNTNWKCHRPGYEELGRVVVRIRVEVLADGKPGQVTVVQSGPEDFNRRAVNCAKAETYLPALDPEGNAIVGSAEFGIEFLN